MLHIFAYMYVFAYVHNIYVYMSNIYAGICICWEIAQLVTLRTGVRILVTAIIFSCAAIYFPAVPHQRPVPLTPCLYGVGG